MAQIGNVKEILEVKNQLECLKRQGVIKGWELPYENILTRLDAALFFFDVADENALLKLKEAFIGYPGFFVEKNNSPMSTMSHVLKFSA